ncbi:MAG: hypothetical protein ACI9J0_003021, partial [Cryomorphaceae bacterium]
RFGLTLADLCLYSNKGSLFRLYIRLFNIGIMLRLPHQA